MRIGDQRRGGLSFSRTVIAPMSFLVAAMILASIAAAVWVAHRQTADMLARERSLAETALATRLGAHEKTTNDYALWDETFDNVVRKGDAGWFQENVARPATEEYGFGLVAVVDADGRVVLGARGGEPLEGSLATTFEGGFDALIARVKAETEADTASGLLLLDGAPALVAASRIRPQGEVADEAPPPDRFLILAQELGPPQLEAISKAYLLPGLTASATASGDASIRLATADGKDRVAFRWRGSDPGGELLLGLLPIMITLLVVFAALTAYVLRQGKAVALRLGESERRALQDPLTGLANRAALFARVEELVAAGQRPGFALAYLDLDGFKQVNDEHGHNVGDDVLLEVARRMAAEVRASDLLVRLGGDEFAILFPGMIEPHALRQIADRVIQAVRAPIDLHGATASVGVTIGIAVSPSDASGTLELIRIADAALYRAKRSGKGTVQFSLSA